VVTAKILDSTGYCDQKFNIGQLSKILMQHILLFNNNKERKMRWFALALALQATVVFVPNPDKGVDFGPVVVIQVPTQPTVPPLKIAAPKLPSKK
jgi:hypothetical protein